MSRPGGWAARPSAASTITAAKSPFRPANSLLNARLTRPSYPAGMNVGGFKRFNWLPMQPVWKDMEIRRARRAEFAKQDQANLDAMNFAMANALQNRITQSSNL